MKKIFYLSTCKSCVKVIDALEGLDGFDFQDIKEQNIDAGALDYAAGKTGSYEALFSRRARKYQSMGLADKSLDEKDYRRLILEEYTFLKRPVIIFDKQVFVGHAKKEVEMARQAILCK